MDIGQRIEELRKEIRETPYHKGTEHYIGLLRARIAKLEDEQLARASHMSSGKGGRGGFAVKKAGDATVVLVGPPSVGKSTLLNALTNAKSPVAPYAFTTVTVIPGMMDYKGSHIQILDVPGLIEGASRGRGRGSEVLSVVRGSDLLVFMTEVGKEGEFERMEVELHEAGVRINQMMPRVRIEKKTKGGIIVHSSAIQPFDNGTVKDVAHELGLKNAGITLRERLTLEKLIDAFAQNRVYVSAIYVVNKADSPTSQVRLGATNAHLRGVADWRHISAKIGKGLGELRDAIWNSLRLVRVYLSKEGKVDRDEPLIMREGDTLADVANKVGTEFAAHVKSAKISGPGAKFPSQGVPLQTQVKDGLEVAFVR